MQRILTVNWQSFLFPYFLNSYFCLKLFDAILDFIQTNNRIQSGIQIKFIIILFIRNPWYVFHPNGNQVFFTAVKRGQPECLVIYNFSTKFRTNRAFPASGPTFSLPNSLSI